MMEMVETIGSTQAEMRRRAEAGAPEGALLALRQSEGRGRMGRAWASEGGNLHLSLLLRLPGHACRAWMPGPWALLAGLAVREAALALLPGAPLRLKWPNDVMAGGRKVAGVVIDAGPGWVVIGVGTNVTHAPQVPGRQTACLADFGAAPDLVALGEAVVAALGRWRATYERDGARPVLAAWADAGHHSGERLRVGSLDGAFAGLAPDGAMLLDVDGHMHRVVAGEVGQASGPTPSPAGRGLG